MCLTEAHAGTDLGLIRTRAEPQADGSYAITGSKIFITGGDQDLTENIVHLVLAKLPDALARKASRCFWCRKCWSMPTAPWAPAMP
jgi:alkylation response protein AidB-like acyl-CoA dehydrogenase